MAEMTLSRVILRAAATLPAEFGESDLVLAAWKLDPGAFGLRGFEDQYPDSREVRWRLMGNRGLAGRGLLERRGIDRYALTPFGRLAASDSADGQTKQTGRPKFHPDRTRFGREIDRLLGTRAYSRFASGWAATITWPDAVAFWGGESHLFRRMNTAAKAIAGAAGGIRVDGRDVTAEEVQRLANVDACLRLAFRHRLIERFGVAQKEYAA